MQSFVSGIHVDAAFLHIADSLFVTLLQSSQAAIPSVELFF
jgi:hypothetical protein